METRLTSGPARVTVLRPDGAFSANLASGVSARRASAPQSHCAFGRYAGLTLMAANSAIWLYVAALVGLSA
jgi:hypothetical protein